MQPVFVEDKFFACGKAPADGLRVIALRAPGIDSTEEFRAGVCSAEEFEIGRDGLDESAEFCHGSEVTGFFRFVHSGYIDFVEPAFLAEVVGHLTEIFTEGGFELGC